MSQGLYYLMLEQASTAAMPFPSGFLHTPTGKALAPNSTLASALPEMPALALDGLERVAGPPARQS